MDVFVHWTGDGAEDLARRLQPADGDGLHLAVITNRGVKVWPEGAPETFCTDHWCCRYAALGANATHKQVAALLGRIAERGLDFVHTETLFNYDGRPAFSLGQGE